MDKHCTQRISLFLCLPWWAKSPKKFSGWLFSWSQWEQVLGLDQNLKGRVLKIFPGIEKCSQSKSSCCDDLGIWNDTVWRGRQRQWGLEDCCTVHFKQQSLKSARAISSQYFTCKGGRKKGRRSPMLLLRQGRRQTGPPSSECEFQGSNARGVFLCSPLRWLTPGPEEPVPQTADTCSSSVSTKEKKNPWASKLFPVPERKRLLMC